MRRTLLLLVGLTAVAAGCGSTKVVTRTVTAPSRPAAHGRQVSLFGHIRSLRRTRAGYELRFDPAWFLTGKTASVAAAEDGAVEAGQPVPNDNYVLDEGHRLLTFEMPADARVMVLTRHGDPNRLGATSIGVAELARLVNGRGRVALTEPLETGVWIAVTNDTVRSVEQQYRP